MIDILFVAFNRLRYTQESFSALIDNTDWSEVRGLYVKDDGSTDGTLDYLREQIKSVPSEVRAFVDDRPLGGPVAAMNAYLDWHVVSRSLEGEEPVEIFAKIDNDFVVCPGWLTEMLRQTTLNPGVDVVGMEPTFGPAFSCPLSDRTVRGARHIGGKGLVRHRIFEQCRPTPRGLSGYQGWTQYQLSHPFQTYTWITPDLPCFGLDQLPFGEWPDLAAEYTERGWHRAWDIYPNDVNMRTYWSWWT